MNKDKRQENIWSAVLIILTLIFGLLLGFFYDKTEAQTTNEIVYIEVPIQDTTQCYLNRSDSIIIMATAISIIETKCQDLTSKNGLFVGYLQMSSGLVDKANKILGRKQFTYNDRHDWSSCVAMFAVLMDDMNPTLDIDRTIDIWNRYCHSVYRKQVKTYYKFLLDVAEKMM